MTTTTTNQNTEQTAETFVVYAKGERIEFVSPHSEKEIICRLINWTNTPDMPLGKNSFACSLAANYCQYKNLSEKQMLWARKLIADWEQKEADRIANKAPEAPKLQFKNIALMLRFARKQGIKRPVIRMGEFKVSLHKRKSDGATYVAVKQRIAESVNTFDYIGSLDENGFMLRNLSQKAQDALKAADVNPLDHAKGYGATTAECCFCGKELTTNESKTAGYGPICAGHYGLPWGSVSEDVKFSWKTLFAAVSEEGNG